MPRKELMAGVDAGGTAFKLAVAEPGGSVRGEARVPTTGPDETLGACAAELKRLADEAGGGIVRIGIASFGPVDVDPSSLGYGSILRTPKAGWEEAPVLKHLRSALDVPGDLDTDVNGALLAEMSSGAAKGTQHAAYVTIGTGIGVGVMTESGFAARPLHPELGHIAVRRHPDDDAYRGLCRFHGDCLEGLASGPALAKRFGELEGLPPNDPCWDAAGFYLAQLCLTIVLAFRVQRIVLGGGVSEAEALVLSVRRHYAELMRGYVEDEPDPAKLIVCAGLGSRAGVLGALLIAARNR